MSEGITEQLIRRCFAAYDAADRTSMESLLAAEFTFTSPYDDHVDRATYFERCWPGAGSFRSRELTRIFVEGNEGFVLYDAVGGDGSRFRNTELFRVEGDRIQSIEVFFGLPPQGD